MTEKKRPPRFDDIAALSKQPPPKKAVVSPFANIFTNPLDTPGKAAGIPTRMTFVDNAANDAVFPVQIEAHIIPSATTVESGQRYPTDVTEPRPTVGYDLKPTVDRCTRPTDGLMVEPTVVSGPDPTVDWVPKSTVGLTPNAPVGLVPEPTVPVGTTFYMAEGLGALFPFSRVKRINRAQDALTAKEEAVYDVLWNRKNLARDWERLSAWGYDKLAAEARTDKKNCAKLVRRLIAKGFIEIVTQADPFTRTPTTYRVFSYGAVLQEQKRRGTSGVIKTGNGIFYAMRVQVPTVHVVEPTVGPDSEHTIGSAPSPTVGFRSQTTVIPRSQSMVDHRPQPTVDCRSPVLLIDTFIDKTEESSSSVLASVAFRLGLDDDAICQIRTDCRANAPNATEDEIAYFLEGKACALLKGRKQIDNLPGLLITAVPKCFVGEPFRLYREEKAKLKRQAEERENRMRIEQEAILADANSTDEDRDFAKRMLGLENSDQSKSD